jgi:polysaccharide biosynthesis protein PslG
MRPLFLLAAVLISCLAASQDNLRLPVPEGWGVAVGFDRETPAELEMMRRAGVKIARLDLFWHRVEREKGVYSFAEYDARVRAFMDHGITPMLILDYGNDLYQRGAPRSPEARAGFVAYARAAVDRFRGRGVIWEMWNEPNGHLYWPPKPDVREYIALALEVGKMFEETAPEEMLVGPASATIDFPFLEACFRAGLLRYWHAVTVHPYRSEEPETVAAEYARLRRLIGRYTPVGARTGIISGEWGYSTADRGISLERQSDFMLRQYLVNLMSGVDATIWFSWRNSEADPHAGDLRYGLVLNDLRTKPAYDGRRAMAEALAGFRYSKRLDLGDPSLYCLLFDNGVDHRLVAWSSTRPLVVAQIPLGAATARVWTVGKAPRVLEAERQALRLTLESTPQIVQPIGPDPFLRQAALIPELPAFAEVGTVEDVRTLFEPFLTLRRPARIGEADETATRPLSETVFRTFPRLEDRHKEARRVRLEISLTGFPPLVQSTVLTHRYPLSAGLVSPLAGRASVIVDNPSGMPFEGRLLVITDKAQLTSPLSFEEGDLSVRRQLQEMPNLFPSERVRIVVEEQGRGGFREVLRTGNVRIHWHDDFVGLPIGAESQKALYSHRTEGDPKVAAEARVTVAQAPRGLSREPVNALKIDYRFEPGWQYLLLNALAERARSLPGTPEFFGMWVHGDGSGAILRMRFEDASGQTFQPEAGPVDWNGWRFVRFALSGEGAGRWGGANDGVVRYPIRIVAPVVLDNPAGAGAEGTIYVTGLFVAGE